MKALPVIAVLMSTHNGSRWLAEQLDSILSQQVDADLRLHVRDDASTDDTLAVLQSWRARHPDRIHVHAGTRLGARDSFLALLDEVGDADCYAFADQDDVWLPGKLAAALAALAGAGKDTSKGDQPALYASAFEEVDAGLRTLGTFRSPPGFGLGKLLVENTLPGCTMVFNRALRDVAVARTPPERGAIVMHDWWLAQLAALCGRIHYDREPRILYRQHGHNLVGIARTPWAQLRARIATLRRTRSGRRASFVDQAIVLRRAAGAGLEADAARTIDTVIALGGALPQRLRAACSRAYGRSRMADDLALRLLAVLGVFGKP